MAVIAPSSLPRERRKAETRRSPARKVTIAGPCQAYASSATDAEAILWRNLRAGHLCAHKFKRQQPIGGFIVDFVCFTQKLVIEVDGGQHADMRLADEARTAWLETQGFRVLRVWNDDVLQRKELVLEELMRALEK